MLWDTSAQDVSTNGVQKIKTKSQNTARIATALTGTSQRQNLDDIMQKQNHSCHYCGRVGESVKTCDKEKKHHHCGGCCPHKKMKFMF